MRLKFLILTVLVAFLFSSGSTRKSSAPKRNNTQNAATNSAASLENQDFIFAHLPVPDNPPRQSGVLRSSNTNHWTKEKLLALMKERREGKSPSGKSLEGKRINTFIMASKQKLGKVLDNKKKYSPEKGKEGGRIEGTNLVVSSTKLHVSEVRKQGTKKNKQVVEKKLVYVVIGLNNENQPVHLEGTFSQPPTKEQINEMVNKFKEHQGKKEKEKKNQKNHTKTKNKTQKQKKNKKN